MKKLRAISTLCVVFLLTFGLTLLKSLPTEASPLVHSNLSSGSSNPAFPLKASANQRYLVDQNNVPFLIAGDSPHGLFGDLSLADAGTYLAGAQANGINSIWVQLLCTPYSSVCPGYTTYDGIAPFSWNGSDPNTFDLSAPNASYFSRMDAMLALAAQYHMTVFLDPFDTGNWLSIVRTNGASKAYNYGVYLGNRYKNTPNIVWLNGNDFQTWSTQSDDALVQAVANGIKSVDSNHLQTVELDFDCSDSLEDSSWNSIITLNTAYSYYPQYDRMLTAYNRKVNGSPVPAYFVEGVYEYQGYEGGYSGPHELRAQEYWVMLSGAAGQLYGNANLYGFPGNWKNSGWQTSPGITQFKVMTDFFNAYPWYNLVPDQNHTVVTSGYGTYATSGFGNTSDYLTAARAADGSLVIAYLPTLRTITVDMSKLSAAATARWFDPANGTYAAISGSPFPNSGSRQFTPGGNNSAGEGDWVLVLQTGSQDPTATPTKTFLPTITKTATLTNTPTNLATKTSTPVFTSTSTKTSAPSAVYTSTSTKTPLPSATKTPVVSPTATNASSFRIGETNILNSDDSGNGGLLVAQQVTVSQNGTLKSLSFYVTSASGRLVLGIYSNSGGNPKTLLAQTAQFTPVVGWNTQAVVTPTTLSAGTYWLTYLAESSNLHFRLAFSGPARWASTPFGGMPGTFSSSPQTGVYHWSFYATLTMITPSKTPTP